VGQGSIGGVPYGLKVGGVEITGEGGGVWIIHFFDEVDDDWG
jgi:hypothetical protein